MSEKSSSRVEVRHPSAPPAGKVRERPTVREEQRLMTRRRIVDAAIATFASKGYTNTTIEDLVAAAGVSRATFYLHFESKLALLQHVGQGNSAWALKTLGAVDGVLPIPRERVEALVRETVYHWQRRLPLMQTMLQAETVEVPMRTQRLKAVERVVEASFPLYLGQFDRRQRDRARHRLVMLTVLLYQYMAYTFINEPSTPADELEVASATLVDILWDQLNAPFPSDLDGA